MIKQPKLPGKHVNQVMGRKGSALDFIIKKAQAHESVQDHFNRILPDNLKGKINFSQLENGELKLTTHSAAFARGIATHST